MQALSCTLHVERRETGAYIRLTAHALANSVPSQWTELDKLIQFTSPDSSDSATPTWSTTNSSSFYPTSKSQSRLASITSSWSDVWRVYEDVCVICAGLWMGSWRSSSSSSPSRDPSRAENWGSIRLTGDDVPSNGPDDDAKSGKSRMYVRTVGMGIEGRPQRSNSPSLDVQEDGVLVNRTSKSTRRASGSSIFTWASTRGTLGGLNSAQKARKASTCTEDEELVSVKRARQVTTTLALLQIFQANTEGLLARLSELLPERSGHSHLLSSSGAGSPIILTPKDLLSFDLGPLSGLDGRFIEWLVEVYGNGARVVVRRGWRDVMALIFGFS